MMLIGKSEDMQKFLLERIVPENLERERERESSKLSHGNTKRLSRNLLGALTVGLSLSFCFNSWANEVRNLAVPDGYESIAAKLITYKDNNFKVFFGGPIVRPDVALWICPVVFEDSALKVKSVYDVIFVNCIPSQAKGAKIYYIEARDTDLMFKNTNNDTYKTFSSLINGKQFGKCVVIRKSDIAMVTYPNVFIDFDCRTAE